MKNVLVGTFGKYNGMDRSLTEVVNELKENKDHVYGLMNGLDDLMNEHLSVLSQYDEETLETIDYDMNHYLKSDYTLLDNNYTLLNRIFFLLNSNNITDIYYSGEDDLGTIQKIKDYASKLKYQLEVHNLSENYILYA